MPTQARVLVLGAAGQVGRALVRRVLQGTSTTAAGPPQLVAFERGPESWQGWKEVDGPPPAAAELV